MISRTPFPIEPSWEYDAGYLSIDRELQCYVAIGIFLVKFAAAFGSVSLDCVCCRERCDLDAEFAEGVEPGFRAGERQVKVLVGITVTDFYAVNLSTLPVADSNVTHQLCGGEEDSGIVDFRYFILINTENALPKFSWFPSNP